MSVLGEAVVAVGADTSGFQREFEAGVKGATQKAGASFTALGRSMTNAGKSLSLTVTAPIIGIGIAAVKSQAQFEQSMNVLQVNAGASGAEVAKLSGLAKQLGADTVFSAGEAADAMLELAKGGFSVAQIEGGGVQATMALAATESINLADAATITSNAMNIFSLKAKDAGSIADALAAGSSASTASVTSLAEGLGNVGAAATQAGLNLQDTVGVLAALDQNGLKGAEGGTALRSFLMKLVPSTKRARDAMDDLNISFVKGDGSIKSIGEIAGVLQDKLGGLTQAQRKQALQTIFGTYASSAATILMKEGTKGVEKFITATEKQGVAQKLADARMSGTAGALEKLRGSLDTAALAAGEALAPAIKTVAKVIGDAANGFTNLNPKVQTAIVAGAALAAALGPVLIVAGSLFRAIGFVKLGLAGMSTAMTTAKTSTTTFATSMLSAETRSTALKGALSKLGSVARSAAGPAGIAALGVAATSSNKDLKMLANVGGAAMLGFAAGGPIGAAVAGVGAFGISLYGALKKGKDGAHDAAKATYDYAASLDAVTGALSRATKEEIRNDLIVSGAADAARMLGVPMRDAIGAITGNEGALKRVNKQIEAVTKGLSDPANVGSAIATGKAVNELRGELGKSAYALETQRGQIRGVTADVTSYGKALRNKVPKQVITELRQEGFDPSINQLNRLIDRYDLTPKQVRTIIRETGADAVITKTGDVRKALHKVGETRTDMGPWAQRLQGDVQGAATKTQNQALTGGVGIGNALKQGVLNGISGLANQLATSAANAVNATVAAARAAGKIKSPSQVMAEVGMDLGRGLALGMTQSHGIVTAASTKMMGAVTPVGMSMHPSVRPAGAPQRSFGATTATQGGPTTNTVTNEGATLVQNFYGPTTSGDRLRELDWTMRYATGRPNEAIA